MDPWTAYAKLVLESTTLCIGRAEDLRCNGSLRKYSGILAEGFYESKMQGQLQEHIKRCRQCKGWEGKAMVSPSPHVSNGRLLPVALAESCDYLVPLEPVKTQNFCSAENKDFLTFEICIETKGKK